nr:capsid protein [Sarcosphaera coronaria partitivirus]
MSKTNSLATKLSALQAKQVTLTVLDKAPPVSSADPLALFEANSAAKYDSANQWIIDVFPSQQTIFCFLLQLASAAAASADHKNHAKSSLATFSLYFMTVYHAFFLLNDLHVRPVPSAHARIWSESSFRYDFATFLLSLPVPDSMQTIFMQLYATQFERTPNIFVIPSAAGFRHDIFFGRFFPLSIFSNLHDCIATVPGNTPRMSILNDLFSRPLYTIRQTVNDANPFIAQLPHLLGYNTEATAGHYSHYASKIHQIFSTIFNPVLFRDFHRRSSLAALDIKPPVFTHATQAVNAYDVLFSATPHNLTELKVVLQALIPIIRSTVPCSKSLSELISSGSGNSILSHGYSDFALPTWSTSDPINFTAFEVEDRTTNVITRTISNEPSVQASVIKFLSPLAAAPAATTPIADFTQVPPPTNLANIQTTRIWPWSLIGNNNPRDSFPRQKHFLEFDDERSAYPKVLVLDIHGHQTVSAHLATLTHKIIESFEIDGCTIEQPRSDRPLGLQNCMFADSCIPYKYVIKGTSIKKRPDDNVLPRPLRRSKPLSRTSLPASTLLIDRIRMFLPSIPGTRIIDPVLPLHLPGFTQIADVDWIRYTQSFLGLTTDSAAANGTDVAHMTDRHLYLFSPYSYTPKEDDDQDAIVPDYNSSSHYFITNLRSIFGTDFNLIEVNHPLEALPIL